jgi:hypothetical protein
MKIQKTPSDDKVRQMEKKTFIGKGEKVLKHSTSPIMYTLNKVIMSPRNTR